jgi:nitrite reductase/ring-hydroxylating ferredoxin subunit
MSDSLKNTGAEHDCDGCPLVDRRSFLQSAAFLVAGAALAVPSAAHALPRIVGTRISREEKSYPIPTADSVSIDKDLDVILARFQGKVYAFNLACPHQNTALKWDDGKHRFQCPKHKSIYTPEGVFVEGRATRGMDRFAVRKNGNNIVVNLDSLLQEDEDADKWKTAFVTV